MTKEASSHQQWKQSHPNKQKENLHNKLSESGPAFLYDGHPYDDPRKY